MLKIGYIGLGIMGKSIARNILKAGFPLVVHLQMGMSELDNSAVIGVIESLAGTRLKET